MRPHSRGAMPGLCSIISPMRGRRERRVLAAPAVSCGKVREKCPHEHTGTDGAFRHSLRNGLTAYAALSPATNSSCHRRCRLDGGSSPVGSDFEKRKTVASSGKSTCSHDSRCTGCGEIHLPCGRMDKDRQRREFLWACARLFACDTRPIVDRGSLILRRRLGIAFMPSWEVGSFVGRENCCALRRESARRADSPSSFLASNFWRRASSLLTRFRAATKTCLRWSECSAVPETLWPRDSAVPLLIRRRLKASVRSLSRSFLSDDFRLSSAARSASPISG